MKRAEIKQKAKLDLKNGYGYAILTMVLLNLVLFGSMTVGLFVGAILVAGAVQCCYISYFNDVAKHKREGVDSTYRGFKQFMRALVLYLWQFLFYVVPLVIIGIILLIVNNVAMAPDSHVNPEFIPVLIGLVSSVLGLLYLVYYIIISLKFYFSFYILNDDVDLKAWDCIKKSMAMTKKKGLKLFVFELSFIGWWLLVLITLGGMNLYVYPYYMTARSNLYFDIKGELNNLNNDNEVVNEKVLD